MKDEAAALSRQLRKPAQQTSDDIAKPKATEPTDGPK
jgi:hypothetical protein